jgi:hypothetical protein
MTYEQFAQIWNEFGFEFTASENLQEALIAASNGDFSHFDEIE